MNVRTTIIRILRFAFRVYPFLHGRGWILRAARLLLGSAPVRFDIGGGTFIEGPLSDYVIVWAFMHEHDRDAPFQRSLALAGAGDAVVDAGANLGIWSLLAARRGARVQAFEPVPAIAARLRRHVADNGVTAIAVNQLALGAERGSLPFFAVTESNTGTSSLSPRAGSVEMRVDVVPLDDCVGRAALLKVDVEGAEILVFRGARRLLSSEDAPMIFFEINEDLCNAFGVTSPEVKRFLADCGYGIFRWDGRAYVRVPLDERHGHEDLFAFKPRHVAKMADS